MALIKKIQITLERPEKYFIFEQSGNNSDSTAFQIEMNFNFHIISKIKNMYKMQFFNGIP